MSTESTCRTCRTPLVQARTGRRRKYCSIACKSRAQRRYAALRAFRTGAKPSAPAPASPASAPQAARLARVKALARALARVKAAEQELAAAKAAREEMDEPEHERSVCTTYTGDEWSERNRSGLPAGPDTSAIAGAIRRLHEGRD